MERSRAALEQLVEEDRSKRAIKEGSRQNYYERSPVGFISPSEFCFY